MKAVTAKSIDSIAQNLTGKPDDYPAALGGSAILDTYLQFMAENSYGQYYFHYFVKNLLRKCCAKNNQYNKSINQCKSFLSEYTIKLFILLLLEHSA